LLWHRITRKVINIFFLILFTLCSYISCEQFRMCCVKCFWNCFVRITSKISLTCVWFTTRSMVFYLNIFRYDIINRRQLFYNSSFHTSVAWTKPSIVVKSPDTDVLVLLIHYFPQMTSTCEVWFQTGMVTSIKDCRRYIPVHEQMRQLVNSYKHYLNFLILKLFRENNE
jgi:hypothetical protein